MKCVNSIAQSSLHLAEDVLHIKYLSSLPTNNHHPNAGFEPPKKLGDPVARHLPVRKVIGKIGSTLDNLGICFTTQSILFYGEFAVSLGPICDEIVPEEIYHTTKSIK